MLLGFAFRGGFFMSHVGDFSDFFLLFVGWKYYYNANKNILLFQDLQKLGRKMVWVADGMVSVIEMFRLILV